MFVFNFYYVLYTNLLIQNKIFSKEVIRNFDRCKAYTDSREVVLLEIEKEQNKSNLKYFLQLVFASQDTHIHCLIFDRAAVCSILHF